MLGCACNNKRERDRERCGRKSEKLHFEPRKEFLLQDPVADWLVAVSASVGVAGAEPPIPRPLATLATSTGLIGSSAGSPPPLSGRPLPAFTLPLPARTHTHTHTQRKHAGVFVGMSPKRSHHYTWHTHTHTHTPPSSADCFCSRPGWRHRRNRFERFPKLTPKDQEKTIWSCFSFKFCNKK